MSGREDNGWTQRSLGNKDIIKVSPSIPSLDLFHLQEPAFTGKELLNHLKWQTELIELLVRNQQQAGMLRDSFAQPGSWCTNLSNTRCSAYGIGGTLWSHSKGTRPPFSKCYSTFRDCPSSLHAQPRMMPAGAPMFSMPGVWPNQPLGVSVGHSLSLNVGQPLGMPFAQPITLHSGQPTMDLTGSQGITTREGKVWPLHDGQPLLQTAGQPFAPQEDHTMAIPLVRALAAPGGQPTTLDGITPSPLGEVKSLNQFRHPALNPWFKMYITHFLCIKITKPTVNSFIMIIENSNGSCWIDAAFRAQQLPLLNMLVIFKFRWVETGR